MFFVLKMPSVSDYSDNRVGRYIQILVWLEQLTMVSPCRPHSFPSTSGTFQSHLCTHANSDHCGTTLLWLRLVLLESWSGCWRRALKSWAASARACRAGTAAARHPLAPEEMNIQHHLLPSTVVARGGVWEAPAAWRACLKEEVVCENPASSCHPKGCWVTMHGGVGCTYSLHNHTLLSNHEYT